MKTRLPLLYFAMLALLLGSAWFLLDRYQHRCTCVLGGHYDETATDWTPREDCAVHGKEMP